MTEDRDSEFTTGINIGNGALSRTSGVDGHISGWVAALEHLQKEKRRDLVVAIAYLCAQVWGYRNSIDQDARLAMTQVESIVRSYEESRRRNS